MSKLEFTKLSSKGQIVIPLDIRHELNLRGGTPFAVMAQQDTILLKKMEMPRIKSWEEAVKPFRKAAGKSELGMGDIERIIEEVRRSR